MGATARIARTIAGFVLGGLTSIEVIVLAVAFIAALGFLWLAGVVAPEDLVTDPWSRSGWAVLVLALLRPITWVPYVVIFLGAQWIVDALAPRSRVLLRNAAAGLVAIGVLASIAWLVVATVSGSGTSVLSFLAFLTGGIPPQDLGEVAGDWDLLRVAGVVAVVMVFRVGLPPLGADLDLSRDPILGFVPGARGRFDRLALIVVVSGTAVLGAIAGIWALAGA